MLKRFIALTPYLIALEDDLDNYPWPALAKLISSLQPLLESTLKLQEADAGANTAIGIINYMKRIASADTHFSKPIRTVLTKYTSDNQIAIALLIFPGGFRSHADCDSGH